MFANFNGIAFEVSNGILRRISFDGSSDFILVRYGQVYSNFPVNRIPSIASLNLSSGDKAEREVYLRQLFENVLYASLELYVLGVAKIESENGTNDSVSRAYLSEFIRNRLCQVFASKIRNKDIVVTCDETNNTADKVDGKDHNVAVHFKPTYGTLHFPSICISRSGVC